MEGIPAPDVADYKRRKEIELGLAAGSISQPQAQRPKVDNKPLSVEQLGAQLETHKALMGGSSDASPTLAREAIAAVYNAAPTAYATPTPVVPPGPSPPPGLPTLGPFIPGVLPPPPSPCISGWTTHASFPYTWIPSRVSRLFIYLSLGLIT